MENVRKWINTGLLLAIVAIQVLLLTAVGGTHEVVASGLEHVQAEFEQTRRELREIRVQMNQIR